MYISRVTEALPLEEEHRPPLVMLPYIEGVSEDVKRVCRCWMAALKNTGSVSNQRPVATTDISSDST